MQSARYINPLTDYGFKKLFGNEDIMIAFLTDLLEPKSPIAHITFLDKDALGESTYERGVIYDLRCTSEDGSEFIVEMQNKGQQNFSDRILYYLSRSISSQERSGDGGWDYELKPVYGIFFINFHLRGFKPMTVRTVQMKVDETGETFNEKMKAFTLELPDYRSMKEEECTRPIDYWLYNLSNMETMTTSMPFQAQRPIFGKVGNIAELINMNEEERQKYNISIDSYRSNLSAMKNERDEGRKEGLAKGRAEGFEKGLAAGRIEIARNMKQMGVAVEVIARSTGLSESEIEAIE